MGSLDTTIRRRQPVQQRIELFATSNGDIYRVRAMDVNTPLDNFDAVIATAAV